MNQRNLYRKAAWILDRVIEGVSHVLGKHPLSENDSVIVNGAVELSGGVFDRLCSRE